MKYKIVTKIILVFAFLTIGGQIIFAQTPRVFVLNSKILSERKTKIFDAKSPDISFKTIIDKLDNDAKKALKPKFFRL